MTEKDLKQLTDISSQKSISSGSTSELEESDIMTDSEEARLNEKEFLNLKRKQQDSVSKKSGSKMHTNSVDLLNDRATNSELA